MTRRDDAPRDLLLGLLALQNALVTRDQLVLAFASWTATPGKHLAALLVEQGALRNEHRPLLDSLVDAHLKLHGGDAERSLAALEINRSTRNSLAEAAPAVEATIARLGSGSGSGSGSTEEADADSTTSFGSGAVGADGERFRILRPHASGGLGTVFVALDTALNREVALKQILPKHADDQGSRRRFLIEAEVTGRLEHPGIVPVYGLGTYPDGRPYYAMRFIKGDSLKETIERFHSADARKTDPGRRSLELRNLLRRFTDVCNAIEYAHSRRVLHRDIKPSNVIVGKHGETLVVDWGLAKPVGGKSESPADAAERSLLPSSGGGSSETLPGSTLGTPAYMSPEQAAGNLDELGPRSDIYSLGATLYCILTGKPPFDGEVAEVLRKVARGEFPRPRQLDPSVDPALEAICLKAMATPPQERYPSCLALKEDLERWAADEPVVVYRAPAPVRLARWARKHRTGVAIAAGLLQTAVVVLAVSTVLLGQSRARIDRERRSAEEARQSAEAAGRLAEAASTRAQAINQFLTNDLLGHANPDRNPAGANLTVRQLLDRAVKSMDNPESSIAREAGVEGAVRSTIGEAYFGLGLYVEARAQLAKAGDLLWKSGAPPEEIWFARNRANWASAMSGSVPLYSALERTFNTCNALLGREHPETVYAADNLALCLTSSARSLPLLRENLEIQRRQFGPDHQLALRAASNLVIVLSHRQSDADLAEADSLARETSQSWVRAYGPKFPETLFALQEQAFILAVRGKLEEARSILSPLLDVMPRALGPDHFQCCRTAQIYGEVLEALGDLDGALARYRQSLAILSKGIGGRLDRDQFEAALDAQLARVELTRGRAAAAVESLLPILRAHAKAKPLSVPNDRLAGALAEALADRGDPKTAIELLTALRDDCTYLEARLDWLRPHLQSLIGGAQLRLGNRAAAADNLRAAVEQMEKSQVKPPAPVLAAARARLAQLDAPAGTK